MKEKLKRTTALLGDMAMERIMASHVAIFGIGGVGGHAAEVLARSGVGEITLVDADDVELSNVNRQLVAMTSTIGRSKVEVMAERIKDINPMCKVNAIQKFFLPENADEFDFAAYDYVIDAVDTVTAKIELVLKAKQYDIPIISAMGAGNKLDATAFEVADIYDTSVCPLAKVMRKELKARGVTGLKCVYSKEPSKATNGERTPASVAWVPATEGLIIGGEVIKFLAKM